METVLRESKEYAAINKMDPSELEAVISLAIFMNPIIKGTDSFTPQFKKLEEATKLEESYSKTEDSKIENCISLAMGVTNSINCLQSSLPLMFVVVDQLKPQVLLIPLKLRLTFFYYRDHRQKPKFCRTSFPKNNLKAAVRPSLISKKGGDSLSLFWI